jgi:hypothetical protein
MEEAFKALVAIFTKSEIETDLEESTKEWSDNLKVCCPHIVFFYLLFICFSTPLNFSFRCGKILSFSRFLQNKR